MVVIMDLNPTGRILAGMGRRKRLRGGEDSGIVAPPGGVIVDNQPKYGEVGFVPAYSIQPAGPMPSPAPSQELLNQINPPSRPSWIKRAWQSVKNARLISRALDGIGARRLADKARSVGLGKKKRKAKKGGKRRK